MHPNHQKIGNKPTSFFLMKLFKNCAFISEVPQPILCCSTCACGYVKQKKQYCEQVGLTMQDKIICFYCISMHMTRKHCRITARVHL